MKEIKLKKRDEPDKITLPAREEIPDIGFYMDQLITYTDRIIADVPLSKTMVNNYIKDEIIFPPNKKRYSREHLMLIILLKILKPVLPMSIIKDYLGPISENAKSDNPEELNLVYDEIKKLYQEVLLISEDNDKNLRELRKSDKALPLIYSFYINAFIRKTHKAIEDF